MKAYAVLDGGGVKGAALVGCLKAAEEQGIEFAGYGGTSAGAIIATLAAVGYEADELLHIMEEELKFTSFLDDTGKSLQAIRGLRSSLVKPWKWPRGACALVKILTALGLYQGLHMAEFVRARIGQKIPTLAKKSDITFGDLKNADCKPLKIVATNLHKRRPKIFEAPEGAGEDPSVLRAVRASAGYPFVFQPVEVNGALMVDGGLCSNLPIFLFEKERKGNALPVIAFDLVQDPPQGVGNYALNEFCRDMLESALESGDQLLRGVVKGVFHVTVQIPADVDTLDFGLTKSKTQALHNAGRADAHSFFAASAPQWSQATSNVEVLQAAIGVPATLVLPVLRAIARVVEKETDAVEVRVAVYLPTETNTLLVVYQYGMDHDPDVDLELRCDGGCSGAAWMARMPMIADLEAAKKDFAEWNMTRSQQNKIRGDRRAMCSFPMFDLSLSAAASPDSLEVLGILSVDTSTALRDTGWIVEEDDEQEMSPALLQLGRLWADVVSRLLT